MRLMSERGELAEALYPKLVRVAGRLRLRRLTYRCRDRCLLLDVVQTPQGVLAHQKRYKFSEGLNETESSPSGRRANTTDGANHWNAQSYFLDDAGRSWDDAVGLRIQCDHQALTLSWREFETDWAAGVAEVVLPR